MIRLCDKSGWTYNYEKTNCGTMFNLSWSADSTMLAGASGNGSLLVGTIVDKVLKNDQFELTLHEDNQIYVLDLIH
jgi:intraflagellar transport protein 80